MRPRGERRARLRLALRWVMFRYERFLALNGSSIYLLLLVVYFVVYLALLGVHLLVLELSDESWHGRHSVPWHVFLELLSPARVSNSPEPNALFKFLSISTTLIGIGFLSTLIAYTTATTTNVIRNFRRGGGLVVERNHSLILGFDGRVADIIRELNLSNESKRALPVVVLAERDKQEMDSRLSRWFSSARRVRLSTARGEPSSLSDLRRVNAREARSAIILGRCDHTASHKERQASDVFVLQTIKALYATQDPARRFPIVAEIFDANRRELISGLDPKIIAVDSNRFLASLLVQSALAPGLERVYRELLSFEMSEVYFYRAPVDQPFGELVFHFEDGVPIGYKALDGQIHLLPPDDHLTLEGEEVLLIASDDSRIHFSPSRLFFPKYRGSLVEERPPQPQRIMIVGWHYLGPQIFEECLRRLPPRSELTVMVPERPESLARCLSRATPLGAEVTVRHVPANPFSRPELEALEPLSYDTVILLSQSGLTETEEQMDADTLMLTLLLRRVRESLPPERARARIVTQLFRPETARLIQPEDGVDFVQTSQVATSLFTQLSEEEDLLRAYDQLFLRRRVALGLKPIELYLPPEELGGPVRFVDVLGAAQSHHEVCVGVKCADPSIAGEPYLGVFVNPPKEREFVLSAGDQVVVLYALPS